MAAPHQRVQCVDGEDRGEDDEEGDRAGQRPVPRHVEAFDAPCERRQHHHAQRELDQRRAAQVGAGAEDALVERAAGDGDERDADREQARAAQRAHVDLVPDDERDAHQAEQHAEPLRRREPLPQVALRDHRRQQRLRRQHQRRDAGRHAEVLRIVTAAEVDRVHQQPGDADVEQLAPVGRPARPRQQHPGRDADHAEGEAQGEEGERRRVLQPGLARQVARAPDDDEVPGEQRIEAFVARRHEVGPGFVIGFGPWPAIRRAPPALRPPRAAPPGRPAA